MNLFLSDFLCIFAQITIFIVELSKHMEKKNNKELINEGTSINVIDITGKLDNYVTLDEFMRRTAFIENESHN